MKIERVRNARGFTLLEVLVSMIILGGALLMLLNMGMIALDANHWSNGTTLAVQSLQQKLEEIRSSGDFTSGADTVGIIARSWSCSSAGPHLQQVDIDATWRDMSDVVRTNTITAFVQTDPL